MKKFFSKTWQLREEALTDCEEAIHDGQNDEDAVFSASLGITLRALEDKIKQVNQKGMEFLNVLLSSQLQSNSASPMELNGIIDILLEKLGENNQRIRDKAAECLLLFCNNPNVGASFVIDRITKGQIKKTAATSTKHIAGRLGLLERVLRNFDVND